MIKTSDSLVKTTYSLNSLVKRALFLFFLLAFFLHAEEEKTEENTEEEQNSSKKVLFDLSKVKKSKIEQICLASANGLSRASIFSEGSIFPTTGRESNLIVDFNRTIPDNVQLCLEGTFYLSDKGDEDNNVRAIRVGFRTPTSRRATKSVERSADTSYAMSVKLSNVGSTAGEKKNLFMTVFSGPLSCAGLKQGDGVDAAASQIIKDSSSGKLSCNTSEPFRFKIIANEKSREITIWVNGESVFNAKSAYDGVEGEMCPFDNIIGFYVRFHDQNPFESQHPAYVKNLICSYILPKE